MLPPIQRVPNDVLLELLRSAYQSSEMDWVSSVDDRTLLSLVCKEWCALILSCTQFWRFVPITRMTSTSFVHRMLLRSGSQDLTVFVNLYTFTIYRKLDLPNNRSMQAQNYVLETLLPIFAPQIHRVVNVSAQCFTERDWKSLLGALTRTNPPRLQSILAGVLIVGDPEYRLPVFATIPPLSSMSITANGLWSDMAIYRQVKKLRLTSSALAEPMAWLSFIAVLKAAPLLCNLQLVDMKWTGLGAFQHVYLDTVVELHISTEVWSSALPIEWLHFKNLRVLRLTTFSTPHEVMVALAESLPRIRRLELLIPEIVLDDVRFDDLLAATGNVSELKLLSPCKKALDCIVASARAQTLTMPKVLSIEVDGTVGQEDGLALLACASSSCSLQVDDGQGRCTKWGLFAGCLTEERTGAVVADTALEGPWVTDRYGPPGRRTSRGSAHFIREFIAQP
ncbi:hypothetical protein R3P38DRAFT_3185907 [Favolaschia claudopus]|uniref:F-box domain-containing protein n=1 Tax=Favolaschia claudopus TaxID=2862362 RepID=A0AAW0C3W8_9AGAR